MCTMQLPETECDLAPAANEAAMPQTECNCFEFNSFEGFSRWGSSRGGDLC